MPSSIVYNLMNTEISVYH